MSSVGETLRRERARRNLDLQQVSEELKISVRFLQAMEAGNFEKLPGGVFAKAFVRQYAKLLELDAEELASEVQRILDPQPAAPMFAEAPARKPDSTPISVPRVPEWESLGDRSWWSEWSSTITALGLVVVVMLVCSAVYAYWQRPHRVVSAPESVAAAAPPAAPPAQAPAQPPPSAATEAPPQSAVVTPAAVPPAAPVADLAAPTPRGAVHVELAFHDEAWVRAQADGKVVLMGTMAPNQTRTVDAGEAVVLRLGNAGAVSITLNGKQLDAVGPVGQVRTVQLTPGGFQIVAPAPPKASVAPFDPL